jgi:hypothetical protein
MTTESRSKEEEIAKRSLVLALAKAATHCSPTGTSVSASGPTPKPELKPANAHEVPITVEPPPLNPLSKN